MSWTILFHDAFEPEFLGLADDVQDELLAHAEVLAEFGPALGRPHVDTLAGSRHANMKELRFKAARRRLACRVRVRPRAPSDPARGGHKSGVSQARFYKTLIKTADARFKGWLDSLSKPSKER